MPSFFNSKAKAEGRSTLSADEKAVRKSFSRGGLAKLRGVSDSTPPVPPTPSLPSPARQDGHDTQRFAMNLTEPSRSGVPTSTSERWRRPSLTPQSNLFASASAVDCTTATLDACDRGAHGGSDTLQPPQPAFLGRRSSSFSNAYQRGNGSLVSFASSAAETASSPPTSARDSEENTHAQVTRDLKAKPSTNAFRSFGKRMFNRSAIVSQRSASSDSSADTCQSSPPLTPTTPPRVAQHGLASKSTMDIMPQLPEVPALSFMSQQQKTSVSALPSLGSFAWDIDPMRSPPRRQSNSLSSTYSSAESGPGSSSWADSTALSLIEISGPLKPAAAQRSPPRSTLTVSPVERSSEMQRDSAPQLHSKVSKRASAFMEEDSDMLRAVLNFGLTDLAASSGPGGAPSPSLPPRMGSMISLKGADSVQASRSMIVSEARQPGAKRLTAAQAKRMEAEAALKDSLWKPIYGRGVARSDLFRRDDNDADSEDEYGDESDDRLASEALFDSPSSSPLARASPLPSGGAASVSAKTAFGRLRPPPSARSTAAAADSDEEASDAFQDARSTAYDSATSSPEVITVPLPTQPVARAESPRPVAIGLDTPAKRALYTCTLLKVHPQLASAFTATPDGQTLLPGAAQILQAKPPSELRFPRSINKVNVLDAHPSTLGLNRDLGTAVARSAVMRKLRREKLPIHQEVELSWFMRRYGTECISPELIVAGLAQRPNVSPEALATPPMVNRASADGSSTSHADSNGANSLQPQMQAVEQECNGMLRWIKRSGFADRMELIMAEALYGPSELDQALQVSSFAVGERVEVPGITAARAKMVEPSPLSFSPRARVLAGLTPRDPTTVLPTPRSFRKRESRAVIRQQNVSEPVHSQGTKGKVRSRSSSQGRSPPPWIAPRQLNSKRSSTLPAEETAPQSMSPQKASVEVRSPSRTSLLPTSPSVRRVTSSSAISVSPSLREEDEAAIANSSDEEDLPLGVLLSQKRAREAERTRIAKLEAEVQELRNREKSRSLQLKREQERQKAKEAERLQEDQKKALRDARERRKVTAHTSVLHSPNYGAGDASMTTSPSARLSPSALSTSATAANINQMSTPKQAGRSSTVLPSPSMSSIGGQNRSSMMPPAHLADPRRGSIQRTEQPLHAMSGIQPHQGYLMASPFTPEQMHHRAFFLPTSASGGYFVPHQHMQQSFSTTHSPSYHSGMPLPLGAPFASPPAQQAQPRRSSSRMAAPQPHHRSPLSPESTPRRQHSAWI